MAAEDDKKANTAPAKRPRSGNAATDDWLPPLPHLTAQPRMTLWRRATQWRQATQRIRPLHLWLGSLGSAVLGGLIMLGVMLYLGQRGGWLSTQPDGTTDDAAVRAPVAPSALVPVSPSNDGHHRPAGSNPAMGSARAHGGDEGPRHERSTSARTSVTDVLTKNDIISVVRQNAPSLAACIDLARGREGVVSGPAKLLIDFVVSPNGTVKAADVRGPDWLQRTSVPKCFASRIRAWRFPASRSGAPVKNLPLPVTF
jgi:hypothetical protein